MQTNQTPQTPGCVVHAYTCGHTQEVAPRTLERPGMAEGLREVFGKPCSACFQRGGGLVEPLVIFGPLS